MGVKMGDVVKIEYILYDEDGTFINSSNISNGDPIKIQLGAGQVINGLERAIIGMSVGEQKEISLEPEEAFGNFEPILVEKVPRFRFPKNIKEGDRIDYVGVNGMNSPAWIRYIEDEYVIVDMNPPLAGKRVKFVIHVVETGLEPDPSPNPFYIGISCNGDCNQAQSNSK
jgi:peptidylprolyl isomerase